MAAPVSRSGVPITDFMGLMTNGGRIASAEDAMMAEAQINLTCTAPMELASRPGLRLVTFDEEPPPPPSYPEP